MIPAAQIAAYFDAINNVGEFEILSQILTGIHRYVRAHGTLSLGLHPLTSVFARPDKVQSFNGNGIVGFFYDRVLVDSLLDRGIGVVNLTENLATGKPVPAVVSDNQQIGRLAAGHLVERGYRRFAYLAMGHLPFSNQRRDGFTSELASRQVPGPEVWFLGDTEVLSPQWFEQHCKMPGPPVGVFAADDNLAVRTSIAAHACNLRVPQDVAIIGVNDLDLICSTAAVPLSSIAPAYVKIGVEAARLLDQLLQGDSVQDKVVRVPPIGVSPRMSTRFLAFDDPLVEHALAYMHANLNQPYNVQSVVDHCGKSRRTLEMRFQSAVGHSMHDEINRLRIERAKQLLSDTEWSIGRVAQECGFGDGKRLVEVFNRIEGKTPRSFRSAEYNA
jgi:LacI family transcriptional regulator